jgi:hypothetical protein
MRAMTCANDPDATMRATLRIDDDLLRELRRLAREEQLSLGGLVSRLLRRALQASSRERKAGRRHREKVFSMGRPTLDLDKALALSASREDQAIVEKMALRKRSSSI